MLSNKQKFTPLENKKIFLAGFVFIPALTLIFLSGIIGGLNADTVYLKNGRTMEGLIKNADQDSIKLDVGFGTAGLQKRDIERIYISTPQEAAAIRQNWEKQKQEEESKEKVKQTVTHLLSTSSPSEIKPPPPPNPKPRPKPKPIDMKQLYSWATPDKILVLKSYIKPVYAYQRFTVQPFGAGFTIHRTWGATPTPVAPCPSVNDVFSWDGDDLYYTDTISFIRGFHYHTNLTNRGNLWAHRFMKIGVVTTDSFTVTYPSKTMTHNGCVEISESGGGREVRYSRQWIDAGASWSPFTGGETNTVSVITLKEENYIATADNWIYRDYSHFYKHPAKGWILLGGEGWYRNPKNGVIKKAWDNRLYAILPATTPIDGTASSYDYPDSP